MALFFVGIDPPVATAPDPLLGNVLGVIAGITWALTILGLRWLGRTNEPGDDAAGAAVAGGNVLACLFCLPLALPVVASTVVDWTLVGYLGAFQIGLAYVWMTRGVRQVPAFETSLLLLLEPVANATWAWRVHGEQPGPWSLTGCAVILVATLARTWQQRSYA